jgi:HEAT repeat protein
MRPQCLCLALAAALLVLAASAGNAQPPVWVDPVEDLRSTLPIRLEELNNPPDVVLQFRRDSLAKKVANLKTIGELRRALALDEWKIDPQRISNDRVRKIDLEMRQRVGDRLLGAIRAAAKSSDANTRLSIANLIAEMGPTIPALDPLDRFGFTRALTSDVVQLSRDSDLGVRQEAIRALGNINPDPQIAMKAIMAVFENDPAVGPRRLAADSLGQMIRVIAHLQKRGRTAVGVEATREDVVIVSREIFLAAGPGARDADPEVRALSLAAVQIAAQTLGDNIPDPYLRRDFPPEGRKLTEGERKDILARYAEVRANAEVVRPMFLALKQNMATYGKLIEDPEPRVRLMAIQTLENIGNARNRLKRRVGSLPVIEPEEGIAKFDPFKILTELDPLDSFLKTELHSVPKLFAEPDIRTRRGAVEFMQTLEGDALPIAQALEAALSDTDRIVRAEAAKAVGMLPAPKAEFLVPALGRLLLDTDLQVRTLAAGSLEAMGPYAKDAVPAMAQSLGRGDVDGQLAVMFALSRVPPEFAKTAVPHLAGLLTNQDPRLLRSAAESLGRIGPAAQLAIPGLRRLLGNEDADVRIAASEAILSITATPAP